METYTIQNLSFYYPDQEEPALKNISLGMEQGEFITLCGPSGCGKSTLLRQLKTVLSPHGRRQGTVLFQGIPLEELDQRTQAAQIGFVLQNPENQIVTDKVWHELAFGLESLGKDNREIRLRTAEMASFFGIQNWFHKSVTELSGGQKQLLNLASIMAMQPSALILDEPTSQLDPIAASEFLAAVQKVNRELSVTVLMTEQRLEEAFPMSDRILVMEGGSLRLSGSPREVGRRLSEEAGGMFLSLPATMRIHTAVENRFACPLTVREGRRWLGDMLKEKEAIPLPIQVQDGKQEGKEEAIRLSQVWFRYDKDGEDVVKGLSFSVGKGELYAIVGGNGTGKSTALSLIAGLRKPWRGRVRIGENGPGGNDPQSLTSGQPLAMLPQNVQSLFVKKTVELDLLEILSQAPLSKEGKKQRVWEMARQCEISHLLSRHPYDLSGGEQQRAALAKVLLLSPGILLLDEPTKGMDGEFKRAFAGILSRLKGDGVTVVMVSHDIEFCAEHADQCAMFFDGAIVSSGPPGAFFSENSFYTTAAGRMSKGLISGAVTAEDVVYALGGRPSPGVGPVRPGEGCGGEGYSWNPPPSPGPGPAPASPKTSPGDLSLTAPQPAIPPSGDKRLGKRTLAACAMILCAIPLTIYFGIYFLDDRKYYFISLLILLEAMLPFVMIFESRKPQARELVIMAVLCGIAVAGRAAFFMLPHFKPVVALVTLTGVCLGAEAGFLVGAMTGFVSNFLFGQGPWTPWQMFSFGIIGFIAGVLFKKGMLPKKRTPLCVFGALAAFLIYGGLMNPASVLVFQSHPTREMILLAYLQGIPLDLIHGAGTAVFLFFLALPMMEKLDRIKVKYGLVEP